MATASGRRRTPWVDGGVPWADSGSLHGFKDSEPNVSKAIKQLQAGARAAEELAPSGVAGPCWCPKSLRTHKRNELRGAAVRFRKHQEGVRRLACGDSLTEALGN